MFDMLRNYDAKKSALQGLDPQLCEMIDALAKYLKERNSSSLKDSIIKFIKEFGGTSRYLLDKDASQEMKNAKMEQIMLAYAIGISKTV